MRRIRIKKINERQYENQAGFTKGKNITDHIRKLWKLMDVTKKNGQRMNIASIDIKGAYDGYAMNSYSKD